MAATVHKPLKVVALIVNGISGQAYDLRKEMQDLKINVALYSETLLKPHMRFYITNYHIYRNDLLNGNKDRTALAVKKEIPLTYVDLPPLLLLEQQGSAYRLDILTCCLHLFINFRLERGETRTSQSSETIERSPFWQVI
jgi:hypothetical protein